MSAALLRVALGRRCPAHVARRAGRRAAARASAPPASPAGIKPSGGTDLGLLVCDDAATRRAPRASRAPACSPRRCCVTPRALRGSTRCAPSSPTPATPTRRPARRGHGRRRARCRARRRWRSASTPRTSVAVASTGVIGVPLRRPTGRQRASLAARGALRADGDATFAEAILTTDAFAKRATLDVELPGGTVRLTRAGQGRRDDRARLRDDALLRADRRGARARDRRPAARRLRQALLRPHLGRRPALDERHGDPAWPAAPAACAVAPESEDELRFGEALDALLRQLALLIVRDGEGARADRARRRHAAGTRRRSSARRARSPTRRWSRPRCTAATPTGAGSRRPSAPRCPATAPLPLDIAIEGVHGVPRRRRGAARRRGARAGGRRRRRSSTTVGLPGEGAETEVFFSDLSHEYVTINAEYTT